MLVIFQPLRNLQFDLPDIVESDEEVEQMFPLLVAFEIGLLHGRDGRSILVPALLVSRWRQ